MTALTIDQTGPCGKSSCGDPDDYAGRTQEKCRQTFIGWVMMDYVTSRNLAWVWARVNESAVSRWITKKLLPGLGTIVNMLASGRLPREREEEVAPIDPRMFQPTIEACDTNMNLVPCEWRDAEIVMDELAALLNMARQWRRVPGTPESVIRDIGRRASQKGQQLSHILRHLGGEGAGQGI